MFCFTLPTYNNTNINPKPPYPHFHREHVNTLHPNHSSANVFELTGSQANMYLQQPSLTLLFLEQMLVVLELTYITPPKRFPKMEERGWVL